MPSPLAHCSLALAAWPPLRAGVRGPVARWRHWVLLGMLLGALVAPDADILLDPLLGRPWFANHGGPVHSLAAGLLFAPLFAAAARMIAPVSLARLAVVGLLAYWSHVVLDACTYGRGVAILWPFMSERVGLPVPLFFGVRHGEWGSWRLHAITLGTESLFAAAVWLVTARIRGHAAWCQPTPSLPPAAQVEGAPR